MDLSLATGGNCMTAKIKKFLFDVLDKGEQNGIVERVFDIFILTLISLNSLAVLFESTINSASFLYFLSVFEVVSVIIFSIEYTLRLWVSDLYYPDKPKWKARIRYAFTGMAIIDLIAILPFYIPFLIPIDLRVLRTLRLVRLMRLFKANRYTKSMEIILKVLKAKSSELISSIIMIMTLMFISSAIMFNVENQAQPGVFRTIFDSLWWASATFTTVGYGDIYPITAMGKFLSAIISIFGIGLVAIPTGIIASGFSEIHQQKETTCPKCGHQFE